MTPTRPLTLLILGASARAAAWSALRAGLSATAADLFADRDLAAVAPCLRVDHGSYPDGLLKAAETFAPAPWLYTGALENRPDLIERLALRRPLWGNDAETVRAVRDPLAVAGALRAAGLPAPEVRLDPLGLPRDGSWLRKPMASAGGYGISPLGPEQAAEERVATGTWYYQRRVDGLSLSAVFVAARGVAALRGVTRQLIGRPDAPFAYRGNLAPWPVASGALRRVEELGRVLAARFGLVGLFGIDFLLGDDEQPWPVEVNPRYTAAVEVIELAVGRSLVDDHRRACEGDAPRKTASAHVRPDRYVAKEIVFAETDGVVGAFDDLGASRLDPFQVPCAADLPAFGTFFRARAPVLTVFAAGPSSDETLLSLARRVRETHQAFRGS